MLRLPLRFSVFGFGPDVPGEIGTTESDNALDTGLKPFFADLLSELGLCGPLGSRYEAHLGFSGSFVEGVPKPR